MASNQPGGGRGAVVGDFSRGSLEGDFWYRTTRAPWRLTPWRGFTSRAARFGGAAAERRR